MAGPGREGAQEAHQRKSGSQTKKGSALALNPGARRSWDTRTYPGRASDYLGAYQLPQGRSNASARSRFTPERPLSQLARSDGVGPIALDRLKPAFERVAHPASTVGMLRREIVVLERVRGEVEQERCGRRPCRELRKRRGVDRRDSLRLPVVEARSTARSVSVTCISSGRAGRTSFQSPSRIAEFPSTRGAYRLHYQERSRRPRPARPPAPIGCHLRRGTRSGRVTPAAAAGVGGSR